MLSRDLGQARAALVEWIAARNPDAREVQVTKLTSPRSGFSGDLLLGDARWSDGGESVERRMVIRVEPARDQVFLDSRFEEQYRVQEILCAHTDIPVPRTIAFEGDPAFLGARFYVTEHVSGRCVDSSSPDDHWWLDLDEDGRRLVWSGGLDQLAAIHRLDLAALGLDFLAEPHRGETPLAQQLHYYREFYEWSAAEYVRTPVLERALDRLDDDRPAETHPPVLLWGDVRHGNVLYDHRGRVTAVIDWEMVALGPPEIDVSWCLAMDRLSRRNPAIAALPSMDSTLPYYERLLGRPMEHLDYYVTFSLTRAAIIQHRLAGLARRLDVPWPMSNLPQGLLEARFAADPPPMAAPHVAPAADPTEETSAMNATPSTGSTGAPRPDATAAEEPTRGPLDGVRVVECGVWHAGPGAGAILADLGATVIKVEPFHGDPERRGGGFLGGTPERWKRADWNPLFEISNRNKQGICLDMGQPGSREIMHRLVGSADVFLTNMRTGTRRKQGIDYASLRDVKPDLVYVNVSGYGPHGPLSELGGYDPLGQAASGMLFLNGHDEPSLLQFILLDQLTAITASHAAITALFARDRNGGGVEVEASLLGSALWLMHANLVQTSLTGHDLDTGFDRTRQAFARTTFRCGDGKWIIGTNHPEERFWEAFCQALGVPEMAHDERYSTQQARRAAGPELIKIFDEIFLTRGQEEWLERLRGAGMLFMPVNTVTDVLAHPQALDNGYVRDVEHPFLGRIRLPGYPVTFSGYPAGPSRPAPGLGEHGDEVLAELGYTEAEIADARSRKLVV